MWQIHRWAKLAAYVQQVANLLTNAPGSSQLAKWCADVHPERTIPAFAPYTFKEWFRKRNGKNRSVRKPDVTQKVILWADTFNNHFHPKTAEAAVEVLEAAGFAVQVPRQDLCCGRP